MRSTSRPVLVAILTGFACAFASAAASAGTTCTTAAECQKGYDCKIVGGTACPGVACAPNTVDCPTLPPCTPEVTRECVVGATCTADTDCAANMVCYETSAGSCTAGAAPCARLSDGSTDCPITPPVCTETKVKNCAFKYTVPCATAADCGDSTLFECVDQMMCSGGFAVGGGGTADTPPPTNASEPTTAPTPTATPTAPAPVPVDAAVVNTVPTDSFTDAGCQPTGVKYCRALPKTCTDNTQCPTDWTCQTTGDIACPAMAYADGATVQCPTQATPSVCAPPGGGWAYDITLGRVVNTSAETGSGIPPTSSPTAGTTQGAAGTTAQGAPGATAAAAPVVDASGGGCSVASTRSNGTAGLLVALGALLALGRRRRI